METQTSTSVDIIAILANRLMNPDSTTMIFLAGVLVGAVFMRYGFARSKALLAMLLPKKK